MEHTFENNGTEQKPGQYGAVDRDNYVCLTHAVKGSWAVQFELSCLDECRRRKTKDFLAFIFFSELN